MYKTCATILAAVVAAILIPATRAQAAGNAVAGKSDFAICSACHSLAPGKNRYGPTLHGLFGRKAGSVPGYSYSPAMTKSDVVWNDATLFKYLANPKAFVPGDKMPFPGIADAQQRRDLIASSKRRNNLATGRSNGSPAPRSQPNNTGDAGC